MKLIFATFSFSLLLFSCGTPIARKPISKKSGSFIQESVTRNLALKAHEEKLIKQLIANDSLQFTESGSGFWYKFLKKDSITGPKPVLGDMVNFDYNLKNLNGNTIYSKKELNNQNYAIDKEIYFYGLREGIKLLQAGETAVFIFPSQLAYGYYGDENKIGSNTPLISEISLNSISKQ